MEVTVKEHWDMSGVAQDLEGDMILFRNWDLATLLAAAAWSHIVIQDKMDFGDREEVHEFVLGEEYFVETKT